MFSGKICAVVVVTCSVIVVLAAKKPAASEKPRITVSKKVTKPGEPGPTTTEKTAVPDTVRKEDVMENTQVHTH